MSKIWSTVTAIIGGAIGLIVVSKLAPTFFGALSDLNGLFNDPATTTGDGTADALLPVFGIVLGVLGLLAVVGWGISSFGVKFGKSRRG